jgi:hypothetical protein
MGQWTTEGLQWAAEALFSEEQSVPANLYLGLAEDVSIAKDDTLASITEIVGPGYGRVAIATDNVDWTSALYGTDNRKQTSKVCSFSATGTWPTCRTWFLATTSDNGGKLLCWDTVDSLFTLESGEGHDQAAEVRFTS